jgi:Protein of unknown function (DUF3048) N-terminal domain/Protein of unknown function (DUF3048) C-terminal domain
MITSGALGDWRARITVVIMVLAVAGCGSATPTPSPVSPAASAASASADAGLSPSPSPSADPSPSPSPSPYPTGIAPLDGMKADASKADRLPLAIMIDDNIPARPQSGFDKASIVYQAPADGGEDRYMLVFQEQDAPDIGPVRSGRPYFVNWAAEYRAGFGHYGGDVKTLAYIPTINGSLIYDLDALRASGSAYHRIKTRVAPHNGYTNTAALYKTAAAHDYPSAMVDGLGVRPFADDLPASQRPSGGSIRIPYNTGVTSYTYDPGANQYLRSVAGRPQYDALDGSRVTARNVVVLYMALSIDPQSERGYARPVLAQIGSGKAIVFRDGKAFVGTWRKKDAGDLTRFYDASGNEITLVRGRIFIQVVPTGTNVTYSLQ